LGSASLEPRYDQGVALRSGQVPAARPGRVAPTAIVSAPARPSSRFDEAARPDADTPRPAAKSEPVGATASTGRSSEPSTPSATRYRGRNHVWIPALGIDRSVTGFSCSSTAYPGNRVYRWGCAGRNNVYLFGHAHSVFRPLHDAYVRGRLKKGMKVIYADAKGRVTTYAVRWWKVVRPDRGEFAYAAQSTPSLTLQTCVGARSQFRLVVRLTRAG
jgi:sortase (surface protein transpeptidase)